MASLIAASIRWEQLLQRFPHVPRIYTSFATVDYPYIKGRELALSASRILRPGVIPNAIKPQNQSHNMQTVVADAVFDLLQVHVSATQPLMDAGLDSLGMFVLASERPHP